MSFAYFVCIVHLTKFTRESSLLWKNLCSWRNKKQKKVFVEKKRKKEYHSVKNTRKILGESELHAGVQISNKDVAVLLKLVIHKAKTDVSFNLCKYQPRYKNMNNRLES